MIFRPRSVAARSRWAVLLACAATLAACGDDGGSSSPGAGNRFGAEGAQIPLGQATCKDWDAASYQAKLDFVAQLRANRSQPITGGGVEGRGSVLEDDFAYDFFENRCSHPASDSFLLYKLYGYAAAFGGTAP